MKSTDRVRQSLIVATIKGDQYDTFSLSYRKLTRNERPVVPSDNSIRLTQQSYMRVPIKKKRGKKNRLVFLYNLKPRIRTSLFLVTDVQEGNLEESSCLVRYYILQCKPLSPKYITPLCIFLLF